jgi:aminoglycoside phosphotransferase
MDAAAAEPLRPAEPDTRLLRAAAASLAGSSDEDGRPETRWVVLRRIERPRSTLFQLRAHTPDGEHADAYYKVSRPPPYASERRERWVTTVRAGLARSMELERRLAGLVEGENIVFARALAVDPDALAVVTLAVPGEAMGKVWRHSLTRGARANAIEPLTLAGRAARLIEQCSTDPIEADTDTQTAAIERRLARVNAILPAATMRRLERRLAELETEMTRSPMPMVYCHGDFSSSNLLLDGDRIGLIDFTWPLRQRGFDLAHFAFRIEYDTAVPPALTAPLLAALVEGYGDPDVTRQPGYRFVRLSKLLKVLEDRRSWSRRRRRARAEIEAEVG